MNHLPEEIQRHIFSFGYAEHRKYMKQLCKKLERDKVLQYNIDVLTSQYNWGGISSFEALLKEVDPDILEKLFNQCVRCNCCTRHCNKRPIYIDSSELTFTENYDDTCHCKCRQVSRQIVKAYDYSDVGYANINHLFRHQFV
jgi:MinD superfamily P-loop ATPase